MYACVFECMYIYTHDAYIKLKRTHVYTHTNTHIHTLSVCMYAPTIPIRRVGERRAQKSPVYTQKSPVYTQKRHKHNQKSPTYAQKSPAYTHKSPIYNHKRPIHNQESPIQVQKSPTYTQKSPFYTQKSPTYTRDANPKRGFFCFPKKKEPLHVGYLWHDIYSWHDSFACVTWLLHRFDKTHLCVRRDSFICTTWPIHVCTVTHSYVQHDSFMCVPWLIHMCIRHVWHWTYMSYSMFNVTRVWCTYEWVMARTWMSESWHAHEWHSETCDIEHMYDMSHCVRHDTLHSIYLYWRDFGTEMY